ncbi:MAG: PAS domain-containing protein [Chloroflexi bacterium]|nr:PAS domain-containing protein [Chloroflexota bacterium]
MIGPISMPPLPDIVLFHADPDLRFVIQRMLELAGQIVAAPRRQTDHRDPAAILALVRRYNPPLVVYDVPLSNAGHWAAAVEARRRDERERSWLLTTADRRALAATLQEVARAELANVLEVTRDIGQLAALGRAVRGVMAEQTEISMQLDATHRIAAVSPSIERSAGYMPEDLIGQDVFDFVHPDQQELGRGFFAHVLTTPGAVAHGQFKWRERGGIWRWADARGFHAPDGPAGARVFVRFRLLPGEAPE